MAELDRRYTETSTVPSKVCVASKKRIIGSPSQSLPPLGCPTWALDKEWNKPEGGNVRPGSQYDVRRCKACVCAYKNKIYTTYKSMVARF